VIKTAYYYEMVTKYLI